MQPAPSPVRRERVGERVALWAARIYFYLKPQSHPHPNLPPPDGGRNKVADTARGRLKPQTQFQTTSSYEQTTPNTPSPSFPRRRESIGNPKKQMFEKQLPRFKRWTPACAGMTVAEQKSMPRRAACPLSRPAGEGWGEGGSMGCTNLILPQAAKPPPS